jgi:hypothetical protein
VPAWGEKLKPYYPGLLPQETRIWRRWLEDHEQDFDSFQYNVPVGPGVVIPRELSLRDDDIARKYRENFKLATQQKIDAIGRRARELWVFEVKDRAGNIALGQILSYGVLLPESLNGQSYTELAIVCRALHPGMEAVFDEHGVLVWIVDVPGPSY